MKSLSESLFASFPQFAPRPADSAAAPRVRSTRKAAQWSAGVHQAYSYLSGRSRDPQQQAEIDRLYEQTLQDGPDFMRVRRAATYAPVPVTVYRKEAAAEIMKQAREIERETYTARQKGRHGGGLGRTALQLLEWFAFVMWPKARFGMYPSLEHIAAQARMHKDTVVEGIKTLERFGFLTVTRRRKRVETPFGMKQVQDTNAYVLNLAKGLGALALAIIGKTSESAKPSAKENILLSKREQPNFDPPDSEKYGFWGQLKEQWDGT